MDCIPNSHIALRFDWSIQSPVDPVPWTSVPGRLTEYASRVTCQMSWKSSEVFSEDPLFRNSHRLIRRVMLFCATTATF